MGPCSENCSCMCGCGHVMTGLCLPLNGVHRWGGLGNSGGCCLVFMYGTVRS